MAHLFLAILVSSYVLRVCGVVYVKWCRDRIRDWKVDLDSLMFLLLVVLLVSFCVVFMKRNEFEFKGGI